ncbi:Rieske (2Fe-2S) protein [Nocardioides sp. W3-2-3]|uniref:Rieske (2Fe-2S) protein n=1 Tax=Nocardioides convexus TaxID=2712224 RepID=UPI002418645F|nr:Rieske (2Fe-2S) protein [Nocardioides convexus]NGZ99847.1 Rieske (2Fe-2S) protein [Nocardioides convexus]
MTAPLSRRRALSGAATLGIGVPLLAACGDDGGTTAGDPATSEAPTSSAPTSAATTESTAGGSSAAASGLVPTADVPVGGGVILKGDELVVTQPKAGEFKAFKAVCTHQGCLVDSVKDGKIVCPCHGSTFDITDGSPQGGPAQTALSAVSVSVEGDQVVQS